jgi:SAM-dependent methyltransferase
MTVEPLSVLGNMDMVDVRCPICEGADFETLATQDRYRMGIRTVGCERCGMILTNPQPTAAAIAQFYAHSYRRFYQSVETPTADYVVGLRKDVRARAVCAHMFGWLKADTIRSVADIGCAEGSLLVVLKKTLPSARYFGAEVNAQFAEYARAQSGATVVSSVDELPTGSFDLVIVNHVLEHIGEPEAYLRKVASLLSPAGRLYIAVPDAASYGGLRDLHIAHLFHYTPVSLKRMLWRSNLGVIRQDITTPPNHPTTIAVLAGADTDANPARLDRDTAGWANVRRAGRFAALYHLRRNPRVRRVLSMLDARREA